MPDCLEGKTEVRVRRCVNGVWVEGWLDANELNGSAAFTAAPLTPAESTPTCGGCPKKAAIDAAKELKWTPAELVMVLKALQK